MNHKHTYSSISYRARNVSMPIAVRSQYKLFNVVKALPTREQRSADQTTEECVVLGQYCHRFCFLVRIREKEKPN